MSWLQGNTPPSQQEVPGVESTSLGARDALHLIVSLGDFQTRMTRDQDAATILDATRLLLRRLMPFRALAFMTVDETDSNFVLTECDPGSTRSLIEKEIDLKIENGTFAWALPQRRAVMVPAARRGHTLVLHPLLTRSRVIGMFIGLLDGSRPNVTDTLLSVLSAILFTTAQALENSSLYRTMKETTVSKALLERANAELRQEIADRRRAEEALRVSEQRYRELFDNANDVIYTHDLDGCLTSINRAAERVFGYGPGEAVGRSFFDMLAPEYVDQARQMIARAVRDSAGATVWETEAVAKDGRRIALEVSARVMSRAGEAVGVQGIARDLTERNRLEAQLQQSQKMEAVGRLAGGVAHDFNNLMMVVMGYTDLMTARIGEGSAVQGDLAQIRKAAESAAALTRQLLAFSRRQVLEPRVLDLDSVVAGIDRMLRRLIGEDIEFVTRSDATLGRVEVDQGQIEQVIMNLVVNARDAMPKGGRLTVETADIERAAPSEGAVGAIRRWVMLSVSDTGHGMDAETSSHIFEPFYTTKEQGKGTGLGLSTVYGIVQQHEGWIEVESEPGRGATFRVYLPRAEEPVEDTASTMTSPFGGSETILLVEDEAPVRDLVRAILTTYGYKVLEAPDGARAVGVFERNSAAIDLLLTDVVMPKMSGRALASRLTAIKPSLRILYMSGYTGDVIGNHGLLDSQVSYLQKPFEPEALARKLRELLDAPRFSAASA